MKILCSDDVLMVQGSRLMVDSRCVDVLMANVSRFTVHVSRFTVHV